MSNLSNQAQPHDFYCLTPQTVTDASSTGPDRYLPLNPHTRLAVNIALCMVDTIRIRFPFRFLDLWFRKFLKLSSKEEDNGFLFHCYHGADKTSSDASVRVLYFPKLWDGQSYLALEFSVPKVVMGFNYARIPWGTDVLAVLNQELAPIFQVLEIEPMDIAEGIFSRLDISENFFVGDNLSRYMKLIRNKVYPRRRRSAIANPKPGIQGDGEDNGVSFRTITKWLSFYDKLAECEELDSQGILRGELSLRSTTDIARLFGYNCAQVKDLRLWKCQEALEGELAALGLDRPAVSIKRIEEILLEKLGFIGSSRLIAFLQHEKDNPGLAAKDLALRLDVTRKTVNSYRKRLKELPFDVLFDTMVELPPLRLEKPPHDLTEQAVVRSGVEKDSNTCNVVDDGHQQSDGIPASGQTAPLPILLRPDPMEFVVSFEVPALVRSLFGKPNIRMVVPAGQGGLDELVESYAIDRYGSVSDPASVAGDYPDNGEPGLPPDWLSETDDSGTGLLPRKLLRTDKLSPPPKASGHRFKDGNGGIL